MAKSRKSKAGQIVVREFSGVNNNAGAKLVRRFEKDLTDGREDIIEKLEAAPHLNEAHKQVLHFLKTRPKLGLARAIAEAGADAATTMDAYAKGAIALGKMETMIALYREMPRLFRDLMRHAIDSETECEVCLGQGKVPTRAGANKLGPTCPRCSGSGKQLTASEHKEFAAKQLLEMSQIMPAKGPMVAIQQNQNIQTGGGEANLLEKFSHMADKIIYDSPGETAPNLKDNIVDAEVVEKKEDK